MRILIGFPEKNSIDAECAVAVSNICRCGHEIEFAYSEGRGVYGVAQARNRLAEQAVDGGYDLLFMVDSDVVVPCNALEFLLDPPEKVVLGCYPFKDGTGDFPLYKFEIVDGSAKTRAGEIQPGRFEVKWGGLGCALVDVDVFRRIERPWFHWDERPSGRHTGEDKWFCLRARESGVRIVADGRVRCGHVGRFVYW